MRSVRSAGGGIVGFFRQIVLGWLNVSGDSIGSGAKAWSLSRWPLFRPLGCAVLPCTGLERFWRLHLITTSAT
jgi:hypothetical protein